jgi:ankyrin repeat protein
MKYILSILLVFTISGSLFANQQLLNAVKSAKLNKIKDILTQGANIDITDKAGKTPVVIAAEYNRMDVVKLLLDTNANYGTRDNKGGTLMHIIAGKKGAANLDVLKKLLQMGADMNARDLKGISPAGRAIKNGCKDNFKAILDAGYFKDSVESEMPAVNFAYENGQADIAAMLIEKEADINRTNNKGESLIHLAVMKNDVKFITKLLGMNVNASKQDSEGRTPLLLAVEKNKRQAAMLLIEKGQDIKSVDIKGRTILHHLASQNNASDLIKKAIEAGIDVNSKDGSEKSPIFYSVSGNRQDNYKLLVEKGASVAAVDGEGKSLLMTAADNKNASMMALLLDAGAKVDGRDRSGKNIVHIVTGMKGGDAEKILTRLIQMKADINEADSSGKSPLMTAIDGKNVRMAKILIENGCEMKQQDKDGQTVLHYLASRSGFLDIMKQIISKGASVSVKDNSDRTPLCLSVMNNAVENADYLLSQGANANDTGPDRKPLVLIAFEKNQLEIFRMLAKKGASINIADSSGNPILITASEKNRTGFVTALLDGGCDVNSRDASQNTALIIAAAKGYSPIVKLLLDKNADANLKGANDDTALLRAIDGGHKGIIETLLSKGADMNAKDKNGVSSLHRAIISKSAAIFDLLLKKGADPNAVNNTGDTLIMQLAQTEAPKGKAKTTKEIKSAIETMKTLKKYNANLNQLNKFGDFALNMSRKKNNIEIMTALLDNGADVNIQDKNGNTVLKKAVLDYIFDYVATQKRGDDTKKMITFLLGKGAKIDMQDTRGRTALSDAVKNANKKNSDKVADIVQFLLTSRAKSDMQDKDGKTAADYANDSGITELRNLFVR